MLVLVIVGKTTLEARDAFSGLMTLIRLTKCQDTLAMYIYQTVPKLFF